MIRGRNPKDTPFKNLHKWCYGIISTPSPTIWGGVGEFQKGFKGGGWRNLKNDMGLLIEVEVEFLMCGLVVLKQLLLIWDTFTEVKTQLINWILVANYFNSIPYGLFDVRLTYGGGKIT